MDGTDVEISGNIQSSDRFTILDLQDDHSLPDSVFIFFFHELIIPIKS